MRRLIVVCEGQTEQGFCINVLAPYMMTKGFAVEAPVIKHSHGGIVPWDTLKRQLIEHLHEGKAIVTMLIDFYQIKDSYRFPGWMEAKSISELKEKMYYLFHKMESDIPDEFRDRFIPYIQLHEFEGLLFSDISAYRNNFSASECDFSALQGAMANHGSPEEINNSPETAPSSRLQRAIIGYNKVVHGSILAEEMGLQTIREKCPLFNSWIERLESIEH